MQHFTTDLFNARPMPRIGVGAMPFSFHGADVDAAAPTWHFAFDLGMTLINTADCYAPSAETFGMNEVQVGNAVRSYAGGRDAITVITKNGLRREGEEWWRDNSYDYMLYAAEASANRLGFAPDGLLLHRRNREQSIEAATRALMAARDRGLAKTIGMSNINADEFRTVWEVSEGTLAFLENERSPRYRDHSEVLDLCTEHGVVYLAWSPLGGKKDARRIGEVVPVFEQVAQRHVINGRTATAQQVALAWLLTQSPVMLPIPAFTRTATAQASADAVGLVLTSEDLELLNSGNYRSESVYPD